MTDKKITQYDELTSVDKDDLFEGVDDPSGTPINKKVKTKNILKSTNTLDNNNTVALTDELFLVDDPSGTPTPEKRTVEEIFNGADVEFSNDADSDNTDVLLTGIAQGVGILIVGCSTDGICAVYRVDNSTLTAISAEGTFSTTKDTASKYNVYYETDQYKVQNNVGDNKAIKIKFIGV